MIKKLKDFIFKILYVLILIYLVIFIPSFWGHKPLVVISGSMEPTLTVGGLLYYERIEIEDFKKGDIVVFETKDHIISHRIIDKKDGKFITKGDANNSKDGVINKSQVVGKVIKILPYFGIIRKTFFNPLVLVTLIITLYTISYVLRSTSKIDNDTNNKKYDYKTKLDKFITRLY